jgi:hypothetical protein
MTLHARGGTGGVPVLLGEEVEFPEFELEFEGPLVAPVHPARAAIVKIKNV